MAVDASESTATNPRSDDPKDSGNEDRSFDVLMQSTFDEFGIAGSPFLYPAFMRRWAAWLFSFDVRLFAVVVWLLHRTWGFFGRFHPHPMAKTWSELAWQYSLQDGLALGRAVAALDAHPAFRNGCRVLGFRNCLEAMFCYGAFLDPFYRPVEIKETEFTHPLQRPQYFVPGIPSHRVYDSGLFEWTETLEASFEAARREAADLLNLKADGFGEFRTDYDNTIAGWNTYIFYVNGRRQEENCRRAPRLAEVADSLLAWEEGELTMLSVLNPRAHIPPHVGPLNGILRCHFPLFIPKDCGLRVGGREIQWEPGKILVFDDSFVHEVWNHSGELRIVLFFNAWHPCLSAAERQALAELRFAYHQAPIGRNWLKRQEEPRPASISQRVTDS